MMRFKFFIETFTCSVLALLSAPDTAGASSKHTDALISWVRSKGGFYNSKLEIRRVEPNDSQSRFGMFATGTIAEEELLLKVPPDILIASRPEEKKSGELDCNIVRSLAREMRLGNESQYAPYANYLSEIKIFEQLPSAWSAAGQSLLLVVLGVNEEGEHVLPPTDPIGWITDEWHKRCDGSDDPFEELAAALVVQRNWDDVLIPVADIIRHRHGKWLNTESTNVHEETGVQIYASRVIEVGEEIYTSHYICDENVDCGIWEASYGTAELFRDHGFVEEYPQKWIFQRQEIAFEIHRTPNDYVYDDDSETDKFDIMWIGDEPSEEDNEFLKEQLERLLELGETILASPETERTIPKNEWNLVLNYHEAMLTALSISTKATEEYDDCLEEGECDLPTRYVSLYDTVEGLSEEDYAGKTCDLENLFPWNDEWEVLEEFQSPYQEIVFFINPENEDMCLELDNIVQICESYRPHYHEMVVHYTARFLDNIKRVLWVGGGDSMLLHEVLKYPSLELVVGLELDQKVTRKSFKYLGTQPHYDNEKVQWWYGDASKTLLMLPKEYFGSFDMVLVDLSETVMSFKVTQGLDIMEALTLLLKPDGIFVKNELYFEKMSSMFDHSIQALSLGSNKINFLKTEMKDHNVNALFIQPLDLIDNPYELVHDYYKNESSIQLCKGGEHDLALGLENEHAEQERSPGILMIVEAEQSTEELLLSDVLQIECIGVLEKEGLSVVSAFLSESGVDKTTMVIVLQEGYIVAHTLPEYKYCAFDIHLWSSFEKHEGIRKALLAAVGSGSESSTSFRIIAGGMFGVGTWKDDVKLRGPRFTQECDHQEETLLDHVLFQHNAIDVIIEGMLDLVDDSLMTVAVLCGGDPEACRTVDVLQNNENVADVVALNCLDMDGINEYVEGGIDRMVVCEEQLTEKLRKELKGEQKLSSIIVDASANSIVAQIVLKIFSSRKNQRHMLMPNVLVMSAESGDTQDWQRNLARRFWKDIFVHEPLFYAAVIFNSTSAEGNNFKADITLSGDETFIQKLNDVLQWIETEIGVVSKVQHIMGGLWVEQEDFKPSQVFVSSDYDLHSPLEQWRSQKPLGYHNIFQLESSIMNLSLHQVREALKISLSEMFSSLNTPTDSAELREYTDIGNGCVLVALWAEGSAIVMWDGNIHIDINLFMFDESENRAKAFKESFSLEIPSLTTVLHDEHPRGIGKVVNYLKDLEPRVDPHWL